MGMADVLVPPSPFLAVKQILTSRRATRQCLQLRPRIRHQVAVETTNPANSPTRKNEIAAKLVRPNKCAKVSVAAGPNPSPTESHGVSFPSKKNICTHCE